MAAKLSESRQKAAEVGARLVASPDAAAELATSQWQPMMQVYREQLVGLIQLQEKILRYCVRTLLPAVAITCALGAR